MFSWREHILETPLASTMTNDSTSWMIGPQRQAPAVNVSRQSPADRQTVGAGLFLHDPPWPIRAALLLLEPEHELGPLDAGLDLDDTGLSIEREDVVQARGIDQGRRGAELLPTHGVAATGDTDLCVVAGGAAHHLP